MATKKARRASDPMLLILLTRNTRKSMKRSSQVDADR